MNEEVSKFLYHSKEARHHEQLAHKHRDRIMRMMEKQGGDPIDIEGTTLRIATIIRKHMSKKETPPNIWEKYAIATPFKVLRIRTKKKK